MGTIQPINNDVLSSILSQMFLPILSDDSDVVAVLSSDFKLRTLGVPAHLRSLKYVTVIEKVNPHVSVSMLR